VGLLASQCRESVVSEIASTKSGEQVVVAALYFPGGGCDRARRTLNRQDKLWFVVMPVRVVVPQEVVFVLALHFELHGGHKLAGKLLERNPCRDAYPAQS
jgi:hypothetical protein